MGPVCSRVWGSRVLNVPLGFGSSLMVFYLRLGCPLLSLGLGLLGKSDCKDGSGNTLKPFRAVGTLDLSLQRAGP